MEMAGICLKGKSPLFIFMGEYIFSNENLMPQFPANNPLDKAIYG